MKKGLIIVIMAIIIIAAVAIPASIYFKGKPVQSGDIITLEQALNYIDTMEQSHQQVIDHPEFLIGVNTTLMGDLKFHAEAVKKYQNLRAFILSREDVNHE